MNQEKYRAIMELLLANNKDSVKLGLVLLSKCDSHIKISALNEIASEVFKNCVYNRETSVGCWEFEYDEVSEGNDDTFEFSFNLVDSCISFTYFTYMEYDDVLEKEVRQYYVRKILISVGKYGSFITIHHYRWLIDKWVRLIIRDIEGKHVKVTGL